MSPLRGIFVPHHMAVTILRHVFKILKHISFFRIIFYTFVRIPEIHRPTKIL